MLKAEVALPIPIDRTLTYAVPPSMVASLKVGMRVAVPVKRKMVAGFVLELAECGPSDRGLKVIAEAVDDLPVITSELIDLARWISEYYIAPLGEVLAAMSPPRAKPKQVWRLRSAPGDLEMEILKTTNPEAASIVQALGRVGFVSVETLRRKTRATGIRARLEALAKQGWVESRSVLPKRRGLGDAPPVAGPDRETTVCARHVLTPGQALAFDGIKAALDRGESKVFLLHGVTGSGKTEVYLRVIEHAVGNGRTAIYLVPEIALTPQIMERARSHFGARCALVHSRLSDRERYTTWLDILAGRIDVVVGPRSAVFAPLDRLGVVVVDEEHEASYKQQDSPRYGAKEVAIMRARRSGAAVVLGSATPAVETYHNALAGKYGLYELPDRIAGGALPAVSVVDARSARGDSPMSEEARQALEASLRRGEQAVLFLNRRGFANYVQCRECGLVPRCRNCNVSLTYHLGGRQLKCHYCGYSQKGWEACPKCGAANVEYVGSGTQKVEDLVARDFPEAVCARFDRDSTRRRGSTEALLNDFSTGLVRLLVGTQMLAKGHDFKSVGLVVVVNADVTMNLPDFRAGERTFQILTQVAGRAGRGEIPGRVIIQTFNPDHHSLAYVAGHDFKGFYGHEAELRHELFYPPFARLARVVFEARKEASARDGAKEFAAMVGQKAGRVRGRLDILGPSRAPISRLKNVYRWHLVLKGEGGKSLSPLVRACMDEARQKGLADGLKISVDIDPQVMV